MKTKGSKLGEKWNVEITDPRSGTGYKTIELTDLSIATSGTYENYRTFADSIEYSHILNPKTGYPIKHNTVSATVIAPNCIDADALATASMSMNPLDAIKLIEDLEFTISSFTKNPFPEYKLIYFPHGRLKVFFFI